MRTSLIHITLLAIVVTMVMSINPSAGATKTVYIHYNKFTWAAKTQAKDVAELLIQTFGGYDGWEVIPAPETRLTDKATVSVTDNSVSALSDVIAANLATQIKKYEEEKQAAQNQPRSPIYSGTATWYRFGDKMTTASRRFPKGTKLRVVAVNSGKTVNVVVNDYGPQVWTGVELDLNAPAFAQLAPLGAGKIQIKYYKL